MDGKEANQVVKCIDRLVPGTDSDAAAAAGDPFLSVCHPEEQAPVSP